MIFWENIIMWTYIKINKINRKNAIKIFKDIILEVCGNHIKLFTEKHNRKMCLYLCLGSTS